MKFLIAPAVSEQLEFGTEGLFTGSNGRFYNYEISFVEDEDIVIKDSIGRYVPMSISEIKGLAEVLCRIDRFQEGKQFFKQALYDELVYGDNIVE